MNAINWLSFLSILSAYKPSYDKSFYNDKIINGYDVDPPQKYFWMAALFERGKHQCGGTLLTDKVVLTAAHCIRGDSVKPYKVHLHRHDISLDAEEEEGAQIFPVAKKIIHPGYDSTTFYNDLAILVLNNTANKPTSIQLDEIQNHKEGMQVTALGWGRSQNLGDSHPILQELPIPVYKNEDCIENYQMGPPPYTINPEVQICAGFEEGGKDTCSGDSGGPLFAYIKDKPTLVGVVSYGTSICAQPRKPGVYARVSYYKKWINEVIQKEAR